MKERITQKLREIEEENKVRILLAVESGSRAWGFASPDSDYDVRFVYVRTKEDYLRLEEKRDVMEFPIDAALDISGWDLQKALRLLYGSNPVLFEWFSSPIVYKETPFAGQLRERLPDYFSPKKSLYHYLNMAENNYRQYLKGDTVKAKKYFYVLRPLLACRWILERHTPPPVKFCNLAKAELPPELTGEVRRLLRLKTDCPEIKEIPRIDAINGFFDEQLGPIRERLAAMPEEKKHSWAELDALFLSAVL